MTLFKVNSDITDALLSAVKTANYERIDFTYK